MLIRMGKRVYGIRGAVFAENTRDGCVQAVDELFSRLFVENSLAEDDIVSIQFTVTQDLTAINPAAALRISSHGGKVGRCALFCCQEAVTDGASPKTIRALVTAYMNEGRIPVHIYANGAEILRPDLTAKEQE
jgi:chorismate mutase